MFATKKFYLDIKPKSLQSPSVKELISDLQLLGGVRFFAKEIALIIYHKKLKQEINFIELMLDVMFIS